MGGIIIGKNNHTTTTTTRFIKVTQGVNIWYTTMVKSGSAKISLLLYIGFWVMDFGRNANFEDPPLTTQIKQRYEQNKLPSLSKNNNKSKKNI